MELKTPLYQTHVELNGKIVPFGGYLLPVQYPLGIIAEHTAVRTKVGLFDVSHMAEIKLSGSGALKNVQHLVTNDCSKMNVGQIKGRKVWCYMGSMSERLAQEFAIRVNQVDSVIELLDGGNTVPFIARYRKEVTGGLDHVTLRKLAERLTYLRNLDERKADVVRLIEEQGKLNEELRFSIEKAETLTEVEDKLSNLSPDLPFGVNHNYDEGYRAGIAAALKVIKEMHDTPAEQETPSVFQDCICPKCGGIAGRAGAAGPFRCPQCGCERAPEGGDGNLD
jgi:hypothetical protein